MARTLRALVLATLLTLPAAGAQPAAALWCDPSDSVCNQLNQAQQQQQSVQDQLKQIAANLADTQQKAGWTRQLIYQLDAQIAAEKNVIADTQSKLDATNRRIRFTQADISRREAQLTVRQQLLDQRVRALDKHGTLNYFELIVTSASFSELIDRVVLMQDVVRSDQQLIGQLRVEGDQVKALEGQLQLQQAQQAALLSQQQAEQAQLDRQRSDQQAALAYLQTLEAQYQQQRDQLNAQTAQLNAEIAQLQQQYDEEAQRLGGGSGQLSWPEQAFISQGFGCSDLLGEPSPPPGVYCRSGHFHYGVDIAGPDENPIHAADAGVVSQIWRGCCYGYGNTVIITHGNGFTTQYSHLSAFFVSVGQGVGRGQPIGAEGSTGYSTGPHLHFGVNYRGTWVNPLNYLG